jgi:membrane protein required for beta-lactamase induction
MKFIGILIALLLEHMLSHVERWREHAWFMRYSQTMVSAFESPRLWNGAWGVAALLLPILLPVGVIQILLRGDIIFQLLGLPFAVAVLLVCLGPRDVAEEVHSYLDARARGDSDAVRRIEHDLCSGPVALKAEPGESLLVQGLLVQSHERLFGVLFWFLFLGPFGAAFYRLSSGLPRILQHVECGEGARTAALRLHGYLAWAPVRLIALLFGLAGSTDDALKAWRSVHIENEESWTARTWRLLVATGCGALQMEDEANRPVSLDFEESLRDALALVQRTLLILLAIMGLFTVGGWLS